jgi:aminoglycoside phosphotransferase family enzyme/predicted kinase
MSLPPLIDALRRPQCYPQRPAEVTVLQTHISYVLLAGGHVYKIKKPVRFSFLDFSSLALRRHFCRQEVLLNRRLAPEVYLGVVGICPDGIGFRFAEESDPGAIEFAVHMRRLDDRQRLDTLVRTDRVPGNLMERIARRLVDFHTTADSGHEVSANGSPEAIWSILEDNYRNASRFRGLTIEAFEDEAIQLYARRFLDREESLFRQREKDGRIRDGHGDLHADHIYANDTLVIVDCIEFSTRFRHCDVASDLAFLAMDLDFHERPDLSCQLVDHYVAQSGDSDLRHLLPFYQCYRAYVRGKVDSLKSIEPEVSEEERRAAEVGARAHFALAYRYTWAMTPAVVALSGLSGSGKSALAEQLARRTGFLHVSSDVLRKQLAGFPPSARPQGEQRDRLYAADHSRRTYDALHAAAAHAWSQGRGVVVDATYQRRADRDALRSWAATAGAPLQFVECRCPEEVIRGRLERRSTAGDSPSDADWAIYLSQHSSFEAFAPGESVWTIATDASLLDLSRQLETCLRSLLADGKSLRKEQT